MNFKKNGKIVASPMEKPKARPKPEIEGFIARGKATRSGTAPTTWHKKAGNVNKGIFDIHVIDV